MLDTDFPFKTTLSLANIIGYWELRKLDSNPLVAENAEKVLAEVDKFPELRAPIEDISILEEHRVLLDTIMSVVFPAAVLEDQILAAFKPFSMMHFYGSRQFNEMISQIGGIDKLHAISKDMLCTKTQMAYQTILYQHYGLKFPSNLNFPLSLKHKNGLTNYYHLNLNPKFCETKLLGELPEFTESELNTIVDNLSEDINLVREKLPPELFEFSGFSLYSMVDATAEEVISSIKEILLKKDSIILDSNFGELEEKFKSLLEQPGIKIGITAFRKNQKIFQQIDGQNYRSLMSDENGQFLEPYYNISGRLQNTGEPYVVRDISKDPYLNDYRKLLPENIKSMMFCPLRMNGRIVGTLEIGSPQVGSISTLTYSKIMDILPLFAIAINRSLDEVDNRITAIIKENYTSIHSSVEWKFVESAHKILENINNRRSAKPEEIVFKNVYPIFAASDIRNSSVARNEAIVGDLSRQLKLAKGIFIKAKEKNEFPILGEIIFKINRMNSRLRKGLISGDENHILQFINQEVEPLIRDLETEFSDFRAVTDCYWSALDNDLRIVYEKRKDFEQSLTRINDTISNYLEEQQEQAQQLFPHFFEKYKTDGVEYNAYIGASLTREKVFKPYHLKNLKLWQLITTAEIARKTALLKSELQVPLDTTHLILVHNQPLSVRFRMEEKQFDVDGAYNMRYEIVKKRIDKVHIKNSEERLTQPDKIAVVYSNVEDAAEYRGYFEYLQHKGYLTNQIEEYELEELQGVSGLKALRVSIEPNSKSIINELENLKEGTVSVES